MRCLLAVAAVLVALPLVAAKPDPEPKKVAPPTGAWERVVGDFTITVQFEKESRVRIKVAGSGSSVDTESAYGVTGDGLLFAVITKVEKNGIDAVSKGDLFSVKYQQDAGKLTLSGLKIDSTEAKPLLEGAYKPVVR